MKKYYIFEVISFAGSCDRLSFDHFDLARDYAYSVYRDAVPVFILRWPLGRVSSDYVPKVWRVSGSLEVSLQSTSVLDLLVHLI